MSTPLVSPTLQEMLQTVRFQLRQPDPNNSTWSDTELLLYINEGIRVHFAELAAIGEGYFTTTAKLDVVAGEEEVALPANFYKVKTLHKITNDDRVILNYRNDLNGSYNIQSNGSGSTYFPSYFFRENKLVLRPQPDFTEADSLQLEYIYLPLTLGDSNDQLSNQISPVFRQVIEAYAIYKAKFSESLVTGSNTYSLAKDHLADLLDQFRKLLEERSKNPTYVVPFNPEG